MHWLTLLFVFYMNSLIKFLWQKKPGMFWVNERNWKWHIGGSEQEARGQRAELKQCPRLSFPLTGRYTAPEWPSALSLSTENVSVFRETCKDKVWNQAPVCCQTWIWRICKPHKSDKHLHRLRPRYKSFSEVPLGRTGVCDVRPWSVAGNWSHPSAVCNQQQPCSWPLRLQKEVGRSASYSIRQTHILRQWWGLAIKEKARNVCWSFISGAKRCSTTKSEGIPVFPPCLFESLEKEILYCRKSTSVRHKKGSLGWSRPSLKSGGQEEHRWGVRAWVYWKHSKESAGEGGPGSGSGAGGQGVQDTLPTVVQEEGKGSKNAENLERDIKTSYYKGTCPQLRLSHGVNRKTTVGRRVLMADCRNIPTAPSGSVVAGFTSVALRREMAWGVLMAEVISN